MIPGKYLQRRSGPRPDGQIWDEVSLKTNTLANKGQRV